MLKRFAICTLGVAAGIGIGATSQPIVTEMLGYKFDEDVVAVVDADIEPSVDIDKNFDTNVDAKTSRPTDSIETAAVAQKEPIEGELTEQPLSEPNNRDMDSDKPSLSTKVYAAQVHQSADGILPYRILRPAKMIPGTEYPLVIFLHGAGERGADNESQLQHAATEFASQTNTIDRQAFVVFPQCPTDQQWSESNWSDVDHQMTDQPTSSMKLVMSLLDDLVSNEPVDETRIYAAGLSMGGYGVLDLVARRPSTFAAAASCCGGSDCSDAVIKRLARTPLYVVHGNKDPVVDVENSRKLVRGIDTAGGNSVYVELPGVGHDCWTRTYNDPQFFEWLFKQKRTSSKSIVDATVANEKPSIKKADLKIPTSPEKVVAKKPKTDNNDAAREPTKSDPTATKPPTSGSKQPAIDAETSEPVQPFDRLAGQWQVRRGIYAGKEISAAALESMSLRFEGRQLVIAQGEKQETGSVIVGGPSVLRDGKQVESFTIVSGKRGVGDIDAIYYFDDSNNSTETGESPESIVMIWNAPGKSAPTSTDPAALPASRIMWLQK